MKILVINAGSSSVKFGLFDMGGNSVPAEGNCQRVGLADSEITYKRADGKKWSFVEDLKDHTAALQRILQLLTDSEMGVLNSIDEIGAVGHRISMGGPNLVRSVRVDDDVIRTAYEMADVAPLHNPPQANCIQVCQDLLGKDFPMVAGFDTAFHQTIPIQHHIFAAPYEYYEKHAMRRYGFHGLSHQFVVERYAKLLDTDLMGSCMVTCHLGGGSSVTAVKDGKSLDNTFGIGTGQGIACGTRAGDFDHVAIGYLMKKENLTYDEVEDILHRKSGLLGISGLSSDEKELEELAQQGNERAQLALDVMARQVKRYIGAYAFAMGKLDTVIFTGGIGENSPIMRGMICEGLEQFGVILDGQANVAHNRTEHRISTPDSKVDIWIVPTNEEWVIARDTMEIVSGFSHGR